MARITTNTEYDSYFWVEWSQAGQDIASNKTKINWSGGVYCGHSFYSNAIRMSGVYINGELVYDGGIYSNFSSGNHTIASGTLDISHNADGTKSFTISSFTGWLYNGHNYSANSTSHTLTPIPRAASITSAPDFKDTDNPTITYSNPAGNSVTALEACISFTSATDDIKYRSIPKTGERYTFSLTAAEKELLLKNTPGPNRKLYFFVRTKIGSTVFHSSMEKTFTVTENDATRPAVTLSVSLENGFKGMYIQGRSRAKVTISAAAKTGASIRSVYATVDGKTYASESFTSDAIRGSGEVTITGYVVDSRGFTGTAEAKVNVRSYSKPLVVPLSTENAILCYRSDGNGKRVGNSTSLWIKAGKSYHGIETNDGINNLCHLLWRWKPASRQWDNSDTWDSLLFGEDGDEYDDMVWGTFDTKMAYTVQLCASDDIGESDIKTIDVPTQDVALHLGKGGKNVSVGTYCDYSEEHTFRSTWKAIFDEDVVIEGNILLGDSKTTLRDYIINVINGGG